MLRHTAVLRAPRQLGSVQDVVSSTGFAFAFAFGCGKSAFCLLELLSGGVVDVGVANGYMEEAYLHECRDKSGPPLWASLRAGVWVGVYAFVFVIMY